MNKQRLLMGKVDSWKEQKCDINRDREAKKKKQSIMEHYIKN